MSDFQEQVAKDLSSIFLNTDEFAEKHTIKSDLGKVTCSCVLQSPTAREQFLSGGAYDHYDGISGAQYVLHVAKDSLLEVPSSGIWLNVDGVDMVVDTCVEDMGMLSITLRENTRE
ncbi:hypothetical protein [Mitsuokella sp.]|uniref:hypothetical protein n=1 Tax=Mitsuokella sp. TaxID=2049034 RepID=UPI003D7CF432